jgi:hypothetical protein
VFLLLLLLPIHFERGKLNLDYRTLTRGDWEYIKFVNKTISRDAILYNDYYRGTTVNSLAAFVERKITYPFLFYFPYLELNGEREIIRNIPDSSLALNILKEKNVSYVTFSTGFNLESSLGFSVPSFNPEKFKSCYEKIYGNYSNWIFKIDYNCSPFIYLPLFLTCKEWCKLPPSISVEIPEVMTHFRLLLLTEVYPMSISHMIGFIEVFQNGEKIETWPIIKSEEKFLLVAEVNPEKILNLTFRGETPYVKDFMILAEVNGNEISSIKNVWAVFINNRDIIVFNPDSMKIKLVMIYNNTKGNVYFNLFNYSTSTWISIGSLERNGSLSLLKKEIDLPKDKFLFLSIASHNFPLEIHNISIILFNYTFLDAESSWIGPRIVKVEELNLSNLISFSPNVYVEGNWRFENGEIVLPPKTFDCHVILSNVPQNFYLKVIYEDKDESEININYWSNTSRKWETAFIFNTKGEHRTKELIVPFFTFQKSAILNFYSHEKELKILNISIEPQ